MAVSGINVVIGANAGDEGKGQWVARLYSKLLSERRNLSPTSIVGVRVSGGAQAGHRAQYVFDKNTSLSFVSSALPVTAFLGSSSFVTGDFLVNPHKMLQEKQTLEALFSPYKTYTPTVYVDPECFVVFPHDVLVNQMVHDYQARTEGGVHGSCGHGIRVAQVRSKEGPLTVLHLLVLTQEKRVFLRYMAGLAGFYNGYLRKTTGDSSLQLPSEFTSFTFLSNLWEECTDFFKHFVLASPEVIASIFDEAILEGNQGLLLDPSRMDLYPHLTPLPTGIKPSISLIRKMVGTSTTLPTINVHYVTRPYLTRHGAGPLEHEGETLPYIPADVNNEANYFQGRMRYAPLNLTCLRDRILRDLKSLEETSSAEKEIIGDRPPLTLNRVSVGVSFPEIITSARKGKGFFFLYNDPDTGELLRRNYCERDPEGRVTSSSFLEIFQRVFESTNISLAMPKSLLMA